MQNRSLGPRLIEHARRRRWRIRLMISWPWVSSLRRRELVVGRAGFGRLDGGNALVSGKLERCRFWVGMVSRPAFAMTDLVAQNNIPRDPCPLSLRWPEKNLADNLAGCRHRYQCGQCYALTTGAAPYRHRSLRGSYATVHRQRCRDLHSRPKPSFWGLCSAEL